MKSTAIRISYRPNWLNYNYNTFGVAGKSLTASSVTARPCLSILRVDLWFAAHKV
jgi:hypothetical protein